MWPCLLVSASAGTFFLIQHWELTAPSGLVLLPLLPWGSGGLFPGLGSLRNEMGTGAGTGLSLGTAASGLGCI